VNLRGEDPSMEKSHPVDSFSGSASTAGLPDAADGVGVEEGVVREDGKPFDERLRHEHPVEGPAPSPLR
jgi:hypothetical protein